MRKLRKIFSFFAPPDKWRTTVILIVGIFTGLVILVLHLGKADSYLSDNPETCINCHVMFPQYLTWQHSSHNRVAVCNDCHVPQENIFRKSLFKATDGLRHSTMFTFRLEPEVIRIKNAGKNAVQNNCERCHNYLWDYIKSCRNLGLTAYTRETPDYYKRYCWDCHIEVPHGSVSSLSSFPYAKIPD